MTGAAAIASDPAVEWAGIDAGFTPEAGTLRAPDLAIGAPASGRGWIPGAPPLAVEYAGVGQDEADLQTKIGELLRGGSLFVWVVRLVGPRRVEVHCPGESIRVLGIGETLEAPGILRNPVPVEALFERAAADRVTLRNLLQRAGYEDLEAVRAEGLEQGREEGVAESILTLLAVRGLAAAPQVVERIRTCRDLEQLRTWLQAAARVTEASDLFSWPPANDPDQ